MTVPATGPGHRRRHAPDRAPRPVDEAGARVVSDRVPHVDRGRRRGDVGRRRRRPRAAPAPAASSTRTARRAARSKALYEWEIDAGPRGRVRPHRAARADGRDRHLRADHLPRRRRPRRPGAAPKRCRTTRCARSASRSSTTPTPRCRPSRATGCCRWRSCPRGTSTRACARRERAADLGLRGVNITSDPQDLGAPDLANRAWDPLWEACSSLAAAGALPHRREPHDDELLRHVPVAVARRRHQARDRRHAAVHRQRARRRQHHLLRHARPVPRAEDRVGGERRRMDPVHPRGARLRDVGERAARPRRALSLLPSEYFKRQIYATTWFERTNLAVADRRRSARTTSCSRPTSRTRRASIPNPLKTAAENMRELSPTVQRKILGENGTKLYRL